MLSKKYTWVSSDNINDEWLNSEYYKPEYMGIENKLKSNKQVNVLKLNEIADINRVTGFEVEKFLRIVDNGIPYLRVKNVEECSLNFEDMQYIPIEVHRIFKKSQFKKDDIALTITGRVGTAAIIPEGTEFNACQDVVKISIRDTIHVDAHYLVLYLNSSYNYKLLNRFNSGGSRPRTLINNVREVTIPVPSSEIQKYIGDKVRKAESKRKEAIRLKSEGEKLITQELGLEELYIKLGNSSQKFSWVSSGELKGRVDSEFYKKEFIVNMEHLSDLANRGLRIVKLKDIINEGSYGILPSSNDYGKGDSVLLRSTNIKEFLIDYTDAINVPQYYYTDKAKVKSGDILLEIKGQCKAGTIINNVRKKMIVNGSIFRFSVREDFNNYYILAYLLCISGQLQKKQNLANSIISYLSIDSINNLLVPIIDRDIQNRIGEMFLKYQEYLEESSRAIEEAKKEIELLIEGTFDDIEKLKQYPKSR